MCFQFPLDSTWALVFATLTLAGFAAYQGIEARRLRFESVKPALSLRPERYIISGPPTFLYLVNNGGLAHNLKIDVSYDDTENSGFVPSLGRGEKARVVEDAHELYNKGSSLSVHVSCRDIYGKRHQQKLSIDFDQLKKGKGPILFVSSFLDTIAHELEVIEHRLDRLRS